MSRIPIYVDGAKHDSCDVEHALSLAGAPNIELVWKRTAKSQKRELCGVVVHEVPQTLAELRRPSYGQDSNHGVTRKDPVYFHLAGSPHVSRMSLITCLDEYRHVVSFLRHWPSILQAEMESLYVDACMYAEAGWYEG